MFLLDTDHCIHLLDGEPGVAARLGGMEPGETMAVCPVVCGELFYMAAKSRRRGENLERVQKLLDDLDLLPLDRETAQVYGALKYRIVEHFAARGAKRGRKITAESLGFKDNDLWIAASALRWGGVLASGDGDFSRLRKAGGPPVENWRK